MDSVAICYEVCDDGMIIRHKHGNPENVRKWAEKTKAKLLESGGSMAKGMADGILIAEISHFRLAASRSKT